MVNVFVINTNALVPPMMSYAGFILRFDCHRVAVFHPKVVLPHIAVKWVVFCGLCPVPYFGLGSPG